MNVAQSFCICLGTDGLSFGTNISSSFMAHSLLVVENGGQIL